jgi:hypothetical protein
MAVHGAGGVLVSLLEHLWWGYGRILRGVRGRRNFSSYVRFEVGDGFKIRFWHGMWREDMVLEEAFLDLFGIACAKEAFVAIFLEISGGSTYHQKRFLVVLLSGM